MLHEALPGTWQRTAGVKPPAKRLPGLRSEENAKRQQAGGKSGPAATTKARAEPLSGSLAPTYTSSKPEIAPLLPVLLSSLGPLRSPGSAPTGVSRVSLLQPFNEPLLFLTTSFQGIYDFEASDDDFAPEKSKRRKQQPQQPPATEPRSTRSLRSSTAPIDGDLDVSARPPAAPSSPGAAYCPSLSCSCFCFYGCCPSCCCFYCYH